MLFRRENDREAIIIYLNGVDLFFCCIFLSSDRHKKPAAIPHGAARRRKAAAGGPVGRVPLSGRQEKGSVGRAGGGDKQRYFIAVLYNANE